MIHQTIKKTFIHLETDYTGSITAIISGDFASQEFVLGDSIYDTCPFLETTLDDLPLQESLELEGMLIHSLSSEFNVDIELYKDNSAITILIIDRSNIYKHLTELNQDRNEIYLVKNLLAKQNKKLVRLRKIAERANEEKSRFLAVMSHEIRNPLNAILGYAEIIESEISDSKTKEHLAALLMAGKSLKVIVNDILDLSRIEAGKLELGSEPVSIQKTIENVVRNFEHQHKENPVRLDYSLSDKLPRQVLGDSVRITQVLSNLLGNAFKFTKKGSIQIEATVIQDREADTLIRIRVKDTGRGMTAKQLQQIFKEYVQTELDDSRVHGGAGLGLSIVKRLVESMAGKVLVESELDVGTTFILEIPFKKVQTQEVAKVEKAESPKDFNLKGAKILLADDDPLNQRLAKHILTKEGVEVTTVGDGLDALAQLKMQKFDLVLMDINMPNMSGEEVLSQKDSFSDFNARTPIIALTANASQDSISNYLSLGFSALIPKPYTSTKVKKIIGSYLIK